MQDRLLHIFRNTPMGRETLLQSLYFCRITNTVLHIYVPESTQFLMYFEHDAVQVDLDGSYLTSPDTSEAHARELAAENGIEPTFLRPKNFTASQLPDIQTNFSYMCCPRSISDLSSKIGLGHIGPKVRRIIKSAAFPVLITSSVFKPWQSITVFFGGSANSGKALRWGLHLKKITGLPLDVFTYMDGQPEDYFEERLKSDGFSEDFAQHVRQWHKIRDKSFEEALYQVPHDAVLVIGAYGHGLIKELIFGSKMELVQSWMPNNMLLVGPKCIFGHS